jgi:hypothetical protein
MSHSVLRSKKTISRESSILLEVCLKSHQATLYREGSSGEASSRLSSGDSKGDGRCGRTLQRVGWYSVAVDGSCLIDIRGYRNKITALVRES